MVEIFIVAVAIFGYAMISESAENSVITAPMFFTTVGLVVGKGGFGWFDLDLGGEAVAILVEATLALVLFVDAVRIDIGALRRDVGVPTRLLSISLPLTVVTGTGLALLLFGEFSLVEAALLAAVLTPTDAALGRAVVSDPRLPARVRQSLNVESGLNDGIMVPVVTVLLAVVASEQLEGGATKFAFDQIGFGLLGGLIVGLIGALILRRRAVQRQVVGVYRQLATVSVAGGAFAAATLFDGNGFLAAFVAGLVFGRLAGPSCQDVVEFTEDEGELLSAITFILFGAVLVGPLLDDLTWQIAVHALGSLTVVRMVPTLIAMFGTGTLMETRLFAGWFGPRGLASILFALLILEEQETVVTEQIFAIAMWTVLASVFLHGVTANPWSGRLAARLRESGDTAELEPMVEMPTRRGPI